MAGQTLAFINKIDSDSLRQSNDSKFKSNLLQLKNNLCMVECTTLAVDNFPTSFRLCEMKRTQFDFLRYTDPNPVDIQFHLFI